MVEAGEPKRGLNEATPKAVKAANAMLLYGTCQSAEYGLGLLLWPN
jgi:hypothetical protein